MKGDSVTNTKMEAMMAAAQKCLPATIGDFILEVNLDASGSGIEYLGRNDFAIYDYPGAEEWLKECHWITEIHRLGDGTFHYVVFDDPQGAVEFKLRWGRQVVKYAR